MGVFAKQKIKYSIIFNNKWDDAWSERCTATTHTWLVTITSREGEKGIRRNVKSKTKFMDVLSYVQIKRTLPFRISNRLIVDSERSGDFQSNDRKEQTNSINLLKLLSAFLQMFRYEKSQHIRTNDIRYTLLSTMDYVTSNPRTVCVQTNDAKRKQ